MTFKAMRFALVAALGMVVSANAATVSMTASPGLVRTQTQGMGTYDAYDFFVAMGDGTTGSPVQFLNYRFIGATTTGSFADPAKLQDDRQTEPSSGAADGNTAGAVDTYMNTVWSAVGKDDLGTPAPPHTINVGSYNPSGSGAAATPIALIDWSVGDALGEDDNNLNDSVVNGPVDQTGPYHLVRILALPGSTGTFEMRVFENDQLGVPEIFQFVFGVTPNVPPTIVDYVEPALINASDPGSYSHQMTMTDPDSPQPGSWGGLNLVSYTPDFGGAGTGPATMPTIDADGTFDWDTVGSPRGHYVFGMTVNDGEGGSDNGTITLSINAVPEPATLGLFGIAMVGALGLVRRRNG